MEAPRWKLIILLVIGFVFVTSLSAAASSRAGKNFFKNFGRASVATWNDVSGKENLHLAAEVALTPQSTSSVKTSIPETKQTAASLVQNTISNITSSIIAAVASSPIVKTIEKLPSEIIAIATSTTPPPPEENSAPTSTPNPVQEEKNVVISVVQVRSVNNAYNDFVVLFNPNWKEIDISNWRLCKKTKTGTSDSFKIFPKGSIIPAKGKFTWANSSNNFYLTVDANIWSSDTIASNNSIALFNGGCGENQIDAVAWGEGANQYVEGAPLPNPDSGQLIQRKFNQDMPIDTNNNLSDFEIK